MGAERRGMRTIILSLSLADWHCITAWLAADLLLLYAAGVWTDPVEWIRTGELILLCGIIVLALVLAGWTVASAVRRQADLPGRQGTKIRRQT